MSQESFGEATLAEVEKTSPEVQYLTVDLRKFLLYVWNRRMLIISTALGGLVLGIAAALIIPAEYDATIRLMPPAAKQTSLNNLFSTRSAGDFSLGLVSSRTVEDDVIEHQQLGRYFHTNKPTMLRSRLSDLVKISVDKDQFVTVVVRAKEPETALRIANEYPEALYRLNRSIAMAEAAHRWEYFEEPLEEEKNKLAAAEESLKQAQQKTGIVLPEAQLRIGVSAVADLRQQIGAREAELAGISTGGTSQNPQVINLKSQINSLYGQMHRLEEQTGGVGKNEVGAKLPELTLEVDRRAREVKFHEALFEVLSRQYENARFEESYSPSIELVDRAVLPDQKSWPTRKLFALLGLLIGGVLGLLIVSLRALEPARRVRNFFHEA